LSLTLQQLIDLVRSMEASDRKTKAIEGGVSSVAISGDTTVAQISWTPKHYDQLLPTSGKCRYSGKDYPHHGGRPTELYVSILW
jgi:hypothetical protein